MSLHEEYYTQEAFFRGLNLLRHRFPEVELAYAVPNGGSRHPIEAARLKATGVKAGVPDVHLPVPRGPHAGLWIEFKSAAGRLSPEQQAWRSLLQSQGHIVVVCRQVDDALAVVQRYLAAPSILTAHRPEQTHEASIPHR